MCSWNALSLGMQMCSGPWMVHLRMTLCRRTESHGWCARCLRFGAWSENVQSKTLRDSQIFLRCVRALYVRASLIKSWNRICIRWYWICTFGSSAKWQLKFLRFDNVFRTLDGLRSRSHLRSHIFCTRTSFARPSWSLQRGGCATVLLNVPNQIRHDYRLGALKCSVSQSQSWQFLHVFFEMQEQWSTTWRNGTPNQAYLWASMCVWIHRRLNHYLVENCVYISH